MARRSIDISGFAHQNPIPAASRVGPLLASSVIAPFNPGERTLPDTFEEQLANVFSHIGEMLEAAGGGWGDVARITFFVSDLKHREAINGPWVEKFPDPAARPARHTQLAAGKGPMVTCEFLAYIED